MKTIFKINISTYIFYLLFILSGLFNYLLIYLFIIFIHEIGHIIMIKILKYKIESIILYPTGCIINTNIKINIKSNHLFLISIAGILNQIILFILIKNNYTYNYDVFYKLNMSLLIFNLLPIYPLDGYKIYLSIFERFISYKLIIKISYIISMLFIFILFYLTKNIYIFVLIYILNINNIYSHKYYYHKFLLERYLYKYNYKNIKCINNINKIYKNRYNYINGISEYSYFMKMFDY